MVNHCIIQALDVGDPSFKNISFMQRLDTFPTKNSIIVNTIAEVHWRTQQCTSLNYLADMMRNYPTLTLSYIMFTYNFHMYKNTLYTWTLASQNVHFLFHACTQDWYNALLVKIEMQLQKYIIFGKVGTLWLVCNLKNWTDNDNNNHAWVV